MFDAAHINTLHDGTFAGELGVVVTVASRDVVSATLTGSRKASSTAASSKRSHPSARPSVSNAHTPRANFASKTAQAIEPTRPKSITNVSWTG